jgi:hypothetical protein
LTIWGISTHFQSLARGGFDDLGNSNPLPATRLGRFWRFGGFQPIFRASPGAVLTVWGISTHFQSLAWGGFDGLENSNPFSAHRPDIGQKELGQSR